MRVTRVGMYASPVVVGTERQRCERVVILLNAVFRVRGPTARGFWQPMGCMRQQCSVLLSTVFTVKL